MQRCVFHAMAGFLGQVDSETRCGFWAEEPADHGFDPGRLITVDLARTPAAAAAKQIGWEQVEVDDCFTAATGHTLAQHRSDPPGRSAGRWRHPGRGAGPWSARSCRKPMSPPK